MPSDPTYPAGTFPKPNRSELEELLAIDLTARGLAFVREFRFEPTRRFRADFGFPDVRLLVEVDGGTWSAGRHVRGSGFARDAEKNNVAQLRGWRVLHFTGSQIRSGQAGATIEKAVRL